MYGEVLNLYFRNLVVGGEYNSWRVELGFV